MGIGGIWGLLDGKIWEWDLSFRWEWNGNGNKVIEIGGNWYEKSIPAHLYCRADLYLWPSDAVLNATLRMYIERCSIFYIPKINCINVNVTNQKYITWKFQ